MARELEGWRGPVVSDTKASRTESSRRVVSYFRVAMPRFRVWICSSASAVGGAEDRVSQCSRLSNNSSSNSRNGQMRLWLRPS